jgi:nucleotide-binding universal stress UspA family protein
VTRLTNLLVATDFTDRSERAVERAFQLRKLAGRGRLTLLHVIAAGLPPELINRRRSEAETLFADRLVSMPADPDLQTSVVTDDPFSAIISEAVIRRADLVVIGAPGKHRYADRFIGTTAECVIRFSDRPVLMVKNASEAPYRRVLVAFDGSEAAIRALHTALAIAPGAEFRVVHAWWPPHTALGGSEATRQAISEENDRLKALIEQAAKEAIASSPCPPAKLGIDMIENNPYLVMRNESTWPDLLVMGTHSKGRLATTISVGKLARHLLGEVTCDVLVSRP